MKQTLLILSLILTSATARAISDNTVEIAYNGTTATVTVASNISSYVTVSSGTSSHVVITQAESFAGVDPTKSNTDGEIIYALSGTSTDGSLLLEGSFKCSVELNGVTLTNPSGPAINIQNGKRISVSAKSSTVNNLTDGANETYNGCLHCKGHLKFKGKGTLNVTGNSRHAIYSKEYCEVKNLVLNIASAVKDGIHCKEYFFMESGTVSISNTGDDGIQVELDTSEGSTQTGITADHEEENTGNFYMEGGTLTINNFTEKAVKADGTATFSGGTHNFNDSDVQDVTAIDAVTVSPASRIIDGIYDIHGRRLSALPQRRSLYIVVENGIAKKYIRK